MTEFFNVLNPNDAILKIRKLDKPTNNLKNYLYVPDSKDPDLIIRTGGEIRLSNFMLWQLAYSELFFINKLWPDFNYNDLRKIIKIFKKSKRNFGSI